MPEYDRPVVTDDYEYDDPEVTAWPDQTTVIIRDQTAPRYGSAEELTREIEALEVRRGRVPSGEVHAIVGKAAGTIEALEGEAARVPGLLAQLEELRAEVAELKGDHDEEALRLWRASKMAEAQRAGEQVFATARAHAAVLVSDARQRADALMEEARKRAALAEKPEGLPAPPTRMPDRLEDAVVRARYQDAVRSWLRTEEEGLDADLDRVAAELDEARALRKARASS